MAKFSKADSRRRYTWWWDSHISPKNSKWLQENLTDMDSKVKLMIKLIEEDGDSFARRAEMYYKKRPELMKLVEEFYRAYRSLAERYDHATGVIRHAHHTMAEAFPNQVQSMFPDDGSTSAPDTDSRSSDPSTPVGGGEFTDESDSVSVSGILAMKQFRDHFMSTDRTRRSLSFDEMEERGQRANSNLKTNPFQDSEEIQALKEAIAKLEAEKEDGLALHQQSLHKLSEVEAEMAKTKEDFGLLSDHVKKAENEVEILSEKLSRVEAEKDSNLQEYQHCIAKISELEENAEKLTEQADSLRSELENLEIDKDAALSKYMESLETISKLENELRLAKEESRLLKERAEKAESELELLREQFFSLAEEKEAVVQKHQHCSDTISALEENLKTAEEELKRLNAEAAKLKDAEEHVSSLETSNRSLHGEIEALLSHMQEEKARVSEAETGLQTLMQSHSRTQDELRTMASELQQRAETLKALETEKQSLEKEVFAVKKQLEEVTASSELSINEMKNEISSLAESKWKLDQEMEASLDQRISMEHEIYHLKEKLDSLKKKHVGILNQVHAVGFNADSLESSVKELKSEKSTLLQKLSILDQLLEKNSILENSLSDLNAELEAARGKIEKLEQLLLSLVDEKSSIFEEKVSLAMQLDEAKKNLVELSQNCRVLESSLADARHELEVVTEKSRIVESSRQLLLNEKSRNDDLISQLEISQLKLENLEKLHGEVEERCAVLVKERASNLCRVEEIQLSLEVEKQKHGNHVQKCSAQSSKSETEMNDLRKECRRRDGELEEVINKTVANDVEIFLLSAAARELKEINHSLSAENHKLSEESLLLGKKVSELEENNTKQDSEIKSLMDQNGNLRCGTHQLLKALDIADDFHCDCKAEKDRFYMNLVLSELKKMKESLKKSDEEKIESAVKLSILLTWIGQLTDMNEDLRSELRKKERKKEALAARIEDSMAQMKDLEASYRDSQNENSVQKRILTDKMEELEAKNRIIGEENSALCHEILNLENLCLIFRAFADERVAVMREMAMDLTVLRDSNAALEGRLEESEAENHHLKEKLKSSQDDIQKLSADTYTLRSENSFLQGSILNLEVELQKRILETNELENGASTLLGKLQYFMVTEFVYEQKLNEVQEAFLGLMAAFAPEIELLRECILSLEGIHSESEQFKDVDDAVSTIRDENNLLFDLHEVRSRFEAAVKEAIRIKEREAVDLRSKKRPEADEVSLSTKDIELDHTSDGCSSRRHRKRASSLEEDEIVELWEEASSGRSKKNEKFRPPFSDSSVDMSELPKKSPDPNREANKRKILERLDSDVQKLANLQIAVQDLKRKLSNSAAAKGGGRGGSKAAFEAETLREQLSEAEASILKLFDLNGRLTKSIDNRSSSDVKSFSSFEVEEDGDPKRRKIAHQERRMSGKIARLDLEIQRLHFVLSKLSDDESKTSVRRRVLLRDYLYGIKGSRSRQKPPRFCMCIDASAAKD